jgi:hypothetical protein
MYQRFATDASPTMTAQTQVSRSRRGHCIADVRERSDRGARVEVGHLIVNPAAASPWR